jgi:hypothetical protein
MDAMLHRALLRNAAWAAVLLALAGMAASAATARQAVQCCFSNAAYAGTCVVDRIGDETCASILAYLNDPKSQGKAYCSNSTIREGWREVDCR